MIAYKGKFDREMRIQHELGTLPLLFWSRELVYLKLPLAKIWHGVNDNPGNATTKVYDLIK